MFYHHLTNLSSFVFLLLCGAIQGTAMLVHSVPAEKKKKRRLVRDIIDTFAAQAECVRDVTRHTGCLSLEFTQALTVVVLTVQTYDT